MSERDLGVASETLNHMLAGAASMERSLHRPWWPAILCGNPSCPNTAVEGFYFCCRDCRDTFVSDWLDESS